MAQDVFDIIKEKEFHELSVDEMKEVMECCETPDEFYNMKNVLNEIEAIAHPQVKPSAKAKENLDLIFNEVHSSKSRIWYSSIGAVIVPINKPVYKQPLMYVAAMLVALFFIYPFGESSVQVNNANPVVAQNEGAQDEQIVSREQSENVILQNESVAEISSIPSDRSIETMSMTDLPITQPSISMFEGGAGVASMPGSDHPDGVFTGVTGELSSIPVSSQPDVLDLLAVTF